METGLPKRWKIVNIRRDRAFVHYLYFNKYIVHSNYTSLIIFTLSFDIAVRFSSVKIICTLQRTVISLCEPFLAV
jgi:hypothetical protein